MLGATKPPSGRLTVVLERRVDFTGAAGLLEVTTEELRRRVHAGEIAAPHPPVEPMGPQISVTAS